MKRLNDRLFIKRCSEAESFTIFENHVYTRKEFVVKFVYFLASNLIQHVIAIDSIKNLDTGSHFAINLVNFLAPNLN